MKIPLLSLAFAAFPASLAEIRTTGSPHYYETSMTTPELEAFHGVLHHCEDDVDRLCEATPQFFAPLFEPRHPMMMRSTMTTTMPPPPPPPPTFARLEDELGSFIDHFMMSAFQTPLQASNFQDGGYVLVITGDNSETDENEQEDEQKMLPSPHEDNMVQHVLSQFVSPESTQEEAEHVLSRVSDHAQLWMEHPDASEPQRRMARRLSEVSMDDMRVANADSNRWRTFLPFTPANNLCLRQAYQQQNAVLHPACSNAISRLESVRASQHMLLVHKKETEQTMLSNLALLYFFVIATSVVLFIRRSRDVHTTRRLRVNVLKAIYSKPHLKHAVEKELGEPIGSVPPLPMPALLRIGTQGKNFSRFLCFSKIARFSILSVLCILMIFAPTAVLPACIVLASMLFYAAICAPKPVRVCTCCCCGTNTEDAASGQVTVDQACCPCCSGTGVCCAQCAQCCGPDAPNDNKEQEGDTCCCCGGDGCCCCCGGGGCCDGKKTSGSADGCSCCCSCCAASKNGYVKMEGDVKVIDCCCCCCGEGKCCGGTNCGTCCCCDGTCCCDPDKCCMSKDGGMSRSRIMASKGAVYEGIPVQIV